MRIQCHFTIWTKYKMARYISRLKRQPLIRRIKRNFKRNISGYFVELLEILRLNIYFKKALYYIYQGIPFNINV